MSNQKLDQIKTAGFILKPNDSEIKTLYKHIKGQFEEKGIAVILAERSADMISLDGVAFDKMCKESDFLVSLGGDGTLLSLVRRSHGYHKPVVGINAGNLGFLADVTIDDVTFVAQADNEVIDTMSSVDFHYMPQNRLITDIYHGFRLYRSLLRNPGPVSSGKNDGFHGVTPPY